MGTNIKKAYTIYFISGGSMDNIEIDAYSLYDALEIFRYEVIRNSSAIKAIIENEIIPAV